MFRLTPPSDEEIRRLISGQENSTFSYPDIGATAAAPPVGYNADRNSVLLGAGEAIWQRANEAVRAWKMFDVSWLRLCWPSARIETGAVVAVCVRHFGFYSLNACRIVYVVDRDSSRDNSTTSRFGFAYGTLADHAESGEERFTPWNGIARAAKSGTTSSLFLGPATHWRASHIRSRERFRGASPRVPNWLCYGRSGRLDLERIYSQ